MANSPENEWTSGERIASTIPPSKAPINKAVGGPQMDLDHIAAFIAAMQQKKLDAMLSHMADDAVFNTPLIAEPVRGKAAIR
jgi:hypothetical protein